jgi:Kef-type K+ transport system membrane component KefB
MKDSVLFAEPWWVNLFIFIPFAAFYFWRKHGLAISVGTLVVCACFGAAFGFVEAAVVIYLSAAVGLLPGYGGTLTDVARLSSELYQKAQIHGDLPESLVTVEVYREIATMVMLLSIAFLSGKFWRERSAIFLWSFAIWDICYYLGLYLTVGWPPSWLTPDVLFLIPVPWLAKVWFPILVSALTMVAVVLVRKPGGRSRSAPA